jgi:hypothetical protein
MAIRTLVLRVSDHLMVLCQRGGLQRRRRRDRREAEYFIRSGFVRKAETGTAIFDSGSGELYFRAEISLAKAFKVTEA